MTAADVPDVLVSMLEQFSKLGYAASVINDPDFSGHLRIHLAGLALCSGFHVYRTSEPCPLCPAGGANEPDAG